MVARALLILVALLAWPGSANGQQPGCAPRGDVVNHLGKKYAEAPVAMGLANSAEEAANLATVATQLGLAMGEDATSSMENFALMMANQSIPRLDSFGISSGKVRERITELMQSTKDMTREQAFNTAVMEQAALTMAKVGEQGNTLAAKTAKAQAKFANFKDTLGQAFMPILNTVMTGLGDLAEKHGPAVIAWVEEAGIWLGVNLPLAMQAASDVWENTLKPAFEGIRSWIEDKAVPAIETIWGWIQDNLNPILAALAAVITLVVIPAFVAWGIAAATSAAATIVALAPVLLPIAAIALAVGLLVKAWEEDWGGIQTFFTGVWENHIKPILEGMKKGFDKVKDAIQWVKDKFQAFKDSLAGFTLPAWVDLFLPGSPPPLAAGLTAVGHAFVTTGKKAIEFEKGLKGISKSGMKVKDTVDKLIPSFSELFARDFGTAALGGGKGGVGGRGIGTGSLGLGGGKSLLTDPGGKSLLRDPSGKSLLTDPGVGGKSLLTDDTPSWSDHVIMPPGDSSGVIGIVQFVYNGKAMGEITLRTGGVATTSIDLATIAASKG